MRKGGRGRRRHRKEGSKRGRGEAVFTRVKRGGGRERAVLWRKSGVAEERGERGKRRRPLPPLSLVFLSSSSLCCYPLPPPIPIPLDPSPLFRSAAVCECVPPPVGGEIEEAPRGGVVVVPAYIQADRFLFIGSNLRWPRQGASVMNY